MQKRRPFGRRFCLCRSANPARGTARIPGPSLVTVIVHENYSGHKIIGPAVEPAFHLACISSRNLAIEPRFPFTKKFT